MSALDGLRRDPTPEEGNVRRLGDTPELRVAGLRQVEAGQQQAARLGVQHEAFKQTVEEPEASAVMYAELNPDRAAAIQAFVQEHHNGDETVMTQMLYREFQEREERGNMDFDVTQVPYEPVVAEVEENPSLLLAQQIQNRVADLPEEELRARVVAVLESDYNTPITDFSSLFEIDLSTCLAEFDGVVSVCEAEIDRERVEKSSNIEMAEVIAEINEMLASDELTQSQINALLSRIAAVPADQLAGEAFAEIRGSQAQLQAVANDLNSVSAIAPTDNPQEAAVLQQIIATAPVTWRAETPTVRYAAIITQINAGQLSDDTRRRAIEALGVSYNASPDITTGTDVNDALKDGAGTERVQTGTEMVEEPPGSGNMVERPIYENQRIPYTEDNPLRPRDNLEIYEEPGGERTVKVTVGDRVIETRVGADVRGEDMGRVANTMAVMQVTESMGLNNVLFQKGFNQLGGGAPITIDWDDMNDAEAVMQSFLGGFSGFDGEVMTEQDTDRLRHNFQWLRRGEVSGDGGAGDHDTVRAMQDLQVLGILNDSGNLVDTKLRAAGDFIQQNTYTGTSRFEQLKAYLETI